MGQLTEAATKTLARMVRPLVCVRGGPIDHLMPRPHAVFSTPNLEWARYNVCCTRIQPLSTVQLMNLSLYTVNPLQPSPPRRVKECCSLRPQSRPPKAGCRGGACRACCPWPIFSAGRAQTRGLVVGALNSSSMLPGEWEGEKGISQAKRGGFGNKTRADGRRARGCAVDDG